MSITSVFSYFEHLYSILGDLAMSPAFSCTGHPTIGYHLAYTSVGIHLPLPLFLGPSLSQLSISYDAVTNTTKISGS